MTPTPSTSWTVRRATGLAALAGLLALFAAAPAAAQDSDLRSLAEQMSQLQRELSDLQRTVYGGAATSGGATMPSGVADTNLAASQEVRIQQLQSQMSGLTGQIEELSYQMQRLQERVDSLANAVGGMMHGGAETPVAEAPAGQAAGQGAAPAAPPTGATPAPEHTFQSQLQAGAGGGATTSDAQPQALTPPQTAAAPTGPYVLPGNTPDEQYQYAFGLLRQANYPEAERALKAFIERNPTSPLAGNAQYWLGETHYVRGDYQSAAIAFAEGYQKYPDSGKAPDNLLKLGMSLGEIGSTADACTALNQLATQFPGAPGNIKERAARERARLGC